MAHYKTASKVIICIVVLSIILIYNPYLNRIDDLIKPVKQVNKSLKKYAAISTNLEKDFYMFYLPMTCESWRRVGFEPIVIIIISDQSDNFIDLTDENRPNLTTIVANEIKVTLNQLQLKVIEYLKRLNVKVFYFKSFPRYEAQLGMLARLFIGYITTNYVQNDDDFIMLTDVDLMPIRHGYYAMNDASESVKIWNAYCCERFTYKGREYDHYPISHIGMRKRQWREILEEYVKSNRSMRFNRETVINVIGRFCGKRCFESTLGIGGDIWYMDQHFISVLIDEYTNRRNMNIEKKAYWGKRLDRGSIEWGPFFWRLYVKWFFFTLTDSHCFKSNLFENIDTIQMLDQRLFNSSLNAVFNTYINEFVTIRTNMMNSNNRDSVLVTLKNL